MAFEQRISSTVDKAQVGEYQHFQLDYLATYACKRDMPDWKGEWKGKTLCKIKLSSEKGASLVQERPK